MELGDKIKQYREKNNLSREELARKIGISLGQLWKIEKGRVKKPHFLTRRRIEKIIGK